MCGAFIRRCSACEHYARRGSVVNGCFDLPVQQLIRVLPRSCWSCSGAPRSWETTVRAMSAQGLAVDQERAHTSASHRRANLPGAGPDQASIGPVRSVDIASTEVAPRKNLRNKEQPGGGSGDRRPGSLDHGAGSSDPGMAQRISWELTILLLATSARAIGRSQRPMARPTSRVEWLP